MNRYFKREEFACKCGCGFTAVDVDVLNVVTKVREYFNAPVIITSACRCVVYNAKVGGANKSLHVNGMAVDIEVKGVAPIDVYSFIMSIIGKKWGLIHYKTFTHFDVRIGFYRPTPKM